MKHIDVTVLDVCGLYPAMRAAQLCTNSQRPSFKPTSYRFYYESTQFEEWNDSYTLTYDYKDRLDKRDVDFAHQLLKRPGDCAMMLKGVMVYAQITAPKQWLTEFNTYTGDGLRISAVQSTDPDCDFFECQTLTGIYMMSYQTLRHIYCHKNNYNSPEWLEFCDFIQTLPLSKELIIG